MLLLKGPAWLNGKAFDPSSRGPGSGPHRIHWVFLGVSLGKPLQSPGVVLVKPRKDMNNVMFRCDITEILLKAG